MINRFRVAREAIFLFSWSLFNWYRTRRDWMVSSMDVFRWLYFGNGTKTNIKSKRSCGKIALLWNNYIYRFIEQEARRGSDIGVAKKDRVSDHHIWWSKLFDNLRFSALPICIVISASHVDFWVSRSPINYAEKSATGILKERWSFFNCYCFRLNENHTRVDWCGKCVFFHNMYKMIDC